MRQLDDINESTLIDILGKIVDEMEDWIIISDRLGKIIYANDAVFKDCYSTKEKVLGEDMCMFVGIDLSDDETLKHIQNFINKGERFEFVTNRFIKGNKRVYLANLLTTVWDNDNLEYYVCISKDITNTQRLKEEIYKANYFDTLTNYPNYKVFADRLSKHIHRAKKNRAKFAVSLVDIRKLGEINNAYGMGIGDHIIKEVGHRIKRELTTNQEIFKYRGNVFAIIEQDVRDETQVGTFLMKVNHIMEEPIQIHNRYMYVELKSGVAFYPNDSLQSPQLIDMAQVALLHAKKQKGIVPYMYYSKGIQEEVENSLQVETELQLAVENDEFIVYYQPFVELKEEKLVGMEALVRRRKKSGEIIPPSGFIDNLEKMHLIEKVGIRILEKVCIQLKEWLSKGYNVVPVSVNLSALQFKNPNLAKDIKSVLQKYNIPSRYVVLEITETTVMEDVGIAQFIIEELKAYGFAISIDDFGTGYASIGYLKKFMFDHLKIDISFIREIVVNAEDRAIVEAIIAIAKTLNLKTIAEGIENEEQLYVMSALGCEMGQGFFWDKPISSFQIEEKYFSVYL